MRIVLLVYDCLPNAGSDPGIGWQAVQNAATLHEVIACTKASNRPAIEAVAPLPNVSWAYIDVPERFGPWSTGTSLGDAVHLVFWLRRARSEVKTMLQTTSIDLTHYVTFSAFWMPVPFADLGVPHVFGPVSGGETVPAPLAGEQSWRSRIGERVRSILQGVATRAPAWQRMAKSADTLMIAATSATAERMRAAGARRVLVWRTGFSLTDGLLAELAALEPADREPDVPLLVCSGRQLAWKGHDLAIHAFALLADEQPGARLVMIGNGPQQDALRALAAQLGVADRVDFVIDADRSAERARLKSADVFLFPSRRDSGSTLLPLVQAMRVPVVAFDTGAVRETTGGSACLAPVGTGQPPAASLATATRRALAGGDDVAGLVDSGAEHAVHAYSERAAVQALDDWYSTVTA